MAESRVARVKQLISRAMTGTAITCVCSILAKVSFALNQSVDVRTKMRPFYIFHGWNANTTIECETGADAAKPEHEHFTEELRSANKLRHALARAARDKKFLSYKYLHDSALQGMPDLTAGQLVLMAVPQHRLLPASSKSGHVLLAGPYRVNEVVGDAALLSDLKGNVVPDLVSRRRLRSIDAYRTSFPIDDATNVTSNKKGSVAAHITIGGRSRQRGGMDERLCYALGEKTRGVWIPEEYLKETKEMMVVADTANRTMD